jgi:hypothetical protein
LLGRHADRSLVLRFGIPAILGAFLGAGLLGVVAELGQTASYSIGSRIAVVTPIKLVVSVLIFGFALFELLPRLRDLKFDRRYLALGGGLSGFFSGVRPVTRGRCDRRFS